MAAAALAVAWAASAVPESEPNDGPLDATLVVLSPTSTTRINGSTQAGLDDVDYFAVHATQPSVVTANLSSSWGCAFSCETLLVQYPNTTTVVDQFGDAIFGEDVEFFLPGNATYYLRVDAGAPGGDYNLSLRMRVARVAADQTVNVLSGNTTGYFRAVASGAYQGGAAEFNLADGSGILFGPCMFLYVRNDEPVPLNVQVPSGFRWRPEDPQIARYVTTRDQSFHVPAWTWLEIPLVAAIEAPVGFYAGYYDIFYLDGMAAGKLQQVTTATAGGNQSHLAEVIAIWAGVEAMDRAELQTWDAPASGISEAGTVLTRAGLSTSINPSTAPAGDGSAILLVVVVLAIVGVAVALLVVARKKARSAAMAPLPVGPPGAPGPFDPAGYPAQAPSSDYAAAVAYSPQPAVQAYAPSAPTYNPPPAPQSQPAMSQYTPPPAPQSQRAMSQYTPPPAPQSQRAMSEYTPPPAPQSQREISSYQPPPTSYTPQPAYQPPSAPQPYNPAPAYQPPPPPVRKSLFGRQPPPPPEIVYVDAPAEESCPKCMSPKKAGATYCLSCGEFFVK